MSYTVTVTHDPTTVVSDVKVDGTITVTNPNGASVDAVVADELSDGTDCTVADGPNHALALNGGTDIDYTCALSGLPTGDLKNTVTVSWGDQPLANGSQLKASSAYFETPVGFTANEIDECVTINDSNSAGPQDKQVCLSDPTFTNPTTFNYSSQVAVPRNDCKDYDNTATFKGNDTETGDDATVSVPVCGPVTGGLTIGFWQNKNGQDLIKSGPSTGTCPLTTNLRNYLPFQDLSATATCPLVATYVGNIIKAANASGASMNAMLKAQMLATALDVFSGYGNMAWPTYKVDGTVNVDLTKIPHPVTSPSNYPSTSAAWGSPCMSVNALLSYANTVSNVGGTLWYANVPNVKATQEQAKDTFDAINNQKAFACDV